MSPMLKSTGVGPLGKCGKLGVDQCRPNSKWSGEAWACRVAKDITSIFCHFSTIHKRDRLTDTQTMEQ